MVTLQTVGFEILSEDTKKEFQKLFDEYSKKIDERLKNAESFRIKIKEYTKGGKTKFSIHVLLTYSGKSLEAEASDWDLNRTFHKVFNKIEQEVEHKFHVSDHRKNKG